MQIKYQTTEGDYVALNVFFSRHSSCVKRNRIIAGLVVSVFFLILILLPRLYFHYWKYLFLDILVFVFLNLWLWLNGDKEIEHFAKKSFKEGQNKGFLGVHELEIDDYGIKEKGEFSEENNAWAAIERIGSTPDYTFIFTGANKAIILPKAQIIEGEYDSFVSELNFRFEKLIAMKPESKQPNILIDHKPVSYVDRRVGCHSGYGIASFILGLTLILFILLACIISIISCWTLQGYEKGLFIAMISFIVLFLAFCLSFVGAGLGILGLLNNNRKRIFSIIGLILNLLIILGSMILSILWKSYFISALDCK